MEILASDADFLAFAVDFSACHTGFAASDADVITYDGDVPVFNIAFTPLMQFLFFNFRFGYCRCRHDNTKLGLAVYRSVGSIRPVPCGLRQC